MKLKKNVESKQSGKSRRIVKRNLRIGRIAEWQLNYGSQLLLYFHKYYYILRDLALIALS